VLFRSLPTGQEEVVLEEKDVRFWMSAVAFAR